jgi:cell division protein FtsN
MDQRIILLIVAAIIVLGIVWYATQTPHVTSPAETPPPATTPTTPPAP